jgi:hypothetical protein
VQVKPRECFFANSPSQWVYMIFITCDNILGVWYRHGQKVKKVADHGPGAYIGWGGVPEFCCIYPGTQGELAETLYELALVYPDAGEWVHRFLFKKQAYVPVSLLMPCGACITSCTITSSKNPCDPGDTVTFTVTITNADGSPTKGDAPEGTLTLSNTNCGTIVIPDDETTSDTGKTVTVTCANKFNSSGTFDIVANYSPEGGFLQTLCSLSQVVNGIATGCCVAQVPATLFLAFTSGPLAGINVTLTYNRTNWFGEFSGCGSPLPIQVFLSCNTGGNVWAVGSSNSYAHFGTGLTGPSSLTCSPFEADFNGIAVSSIGSCGGTVNIKVTA